ncbi:MAG: YgjV family protein [Clostridia bacterium]|nr:YgjV family protein [Clostridia bacterium]
MELIAQILGLMALGTNIICYQLNEKKKILIVQIIASVLWVLNLFLKGAYAGVLLNVHAVVRLMFYAMRDKHKWMRSNWWVVFFCVTAGVCVLVTYQSPVDIIALIGTFMTVVSFSMSNPALVRLVTLPSPPCWFVYHLTARNIGGVLNEIFVISSILVGMIRHDIPAWKEKRRKNQ